ncbi:hypothetical protein [Rubrobacter marinus]|nr:hypothetical protein [Rubrobacter marinus]
MRRLSPAADYHRSLIGARETADGGLEVWAWSTPARGG